MHHVSAFPLSKLPDLLFGELELSFCHSLCYFIWLCFQSMRCLICESFTDASARATFSGQLIDFSTYREEPDLLKIPKPLFYTPISTLSYAA
jgi:hypothetical protein